MSVRKDILIFKLLAHYEVVAEHQQLKSAADALGLKQSNLSKEMNELEALVGSKLLSRTSHGVKLTLDGERLYFKAEECIKKVAELENHFKSAGLSGGITVRLPSVSLFIFQDYLDQFKLKYPKVTCSFSTNEITSASTLKDVDVCATYMQDKWDNVDVICEGKMIFSLVTTQKYIDKYGIPKDIDDLYRNHHLCVCNEHAHLNNTYDSRRSCWQHLDFQVSNYEMLISLLRAKYLIAYIPTYWLDVFPDLIRLDIDGWNMKMPLRVITAVGRSKVPYINTMCGYVIDMCDALGHVGSFENLMVSPVYLQNRL